MRKWKKVPLDVSSEGAMEEEKAGAGDAPPPVGASTDAAGAAPISMSKNAAKKAAKARAKAEAKAKARVEKGLDPNPPKNPRQKLVPLLETTRLAKLAGTKRADPEPPHDPDDASPSTSIKKLPKSAVFKRTNKDNEVVAEDEDEYYEWRPVDPDYYRNETPPGSDDDEGADEGAEGADGGADTAVDPRPTWMRRKQRAAEKKQRAESQMPPDPQPKPPPVRIENHGPWLPQTSHATIHAAWKMQTFASDVFICSYPKSGTTWMQNIVAQIITNCERKKNGVTGEKMRFKHISDVSPFLEIDPHWDHDVVDTYGRPVNVKSVDANFAKFERRTFNTHLPFELTPGRGKPGEIFLPWEVWAHKPGISIRPRYVYVVRDGRDCAVSFYKHLSAQAPEDGGYTKGWDTFFDEWIDGKIAFGGWCEHLKSWKVAGDHDPAVLVVRYEDMKNDLREVVRRVAVHVLGGPCQVTDQDLYQIAARCSFDRMRKDIDRFQPKSVRWSDPDYCFIRKGAIGDGAATFSPEQEARYREKIEKVFGVDRFGKPRDPPLLHRRSEMYSDIGVWEEAYTGLPERPIARY